MFESYFRSHAPYAGLTFLFVCAVAVQYIALGLYKSILSFRRWFYDPFRITKRITGKMVKACARHDLAAFIIAGNCNGEAGDDHEVENIWVGYAGCKHVARKGFASAIADNPELASMLREELDNAEALRL